MNSNRRGGACGRGRGGRGRGRRGGRRGNATPRAPRTSRTPRTASARGSIRAPTIQKSYIRQMGEYFTRLSNYCNSCQYYLRLSMSTISMIVAVVIILH